MHLVKHFQKILFACAVFCTLVSNCRAQGQAAAGELIGALANKRFAEDIELVDSQQKRIVELVTTLSKFRDQLGEQKQLDFKNAPAKDREKIETAYKGKYEIFQSNIAIKARDTLLPFQIERVEQLIRQQERKNTRDLTSSNLFQQKIIDYLGVSEDQEKRLRDKSEKLNASIEQKIKKILKDANDELLDELTSDQRSKYMQLFGEPMAPETAKQNSATGSDKN